MRRKRLLVGLSVLIVGLGAAGLIVWRRYALRAAQPVAAEAQAAAEIDILLPVTVRASQVTAIPAPIEGTIESFQAEVGDNVFEGQVLAHIRNTGLESSREQASAVLERAQEKVNRLESAVIEGRLEASRASADAGRARGEYDRTARIYQRQQILFREGATPRLSFERAEKDYNTAKAESESLDAVAKQVEERVASNGKELEHAKRTLEERRAEYEQAALDAGAADLKSPVDGLLVGRRGAEGDEVSREVQDLFQIAVDLTVLQAVAEPDPKAFPLIKAGQPALIYFPELGGEGVQAQVKEVKDGNAILEFPNPGPAVKPGLTAQARIRVANR